MEGEARDIRLEVTSAIHEGQRFDETFFSVAEDITSAFRRNVHFCGFLSDEELSERLYSADAYVAFFPRGVRENNTTVMTAMSHGCPVITNLDEWSPKWLRHGETVFDVSRLARIPEQSVLRSVGEAGMYVVRKFSFERLVQILI
jgi:glycosyltransferase involved in cell wall biosynthesis